MADNKLKELKDKANRLNKELKLRKELEKKEKELRKLQKPTNLFGTSGFSEITPLTSNIISETQPKSLTGVRNPINDTEKMWVESWWENRKTLDPNFDIDNWFKSSVHMDLKDRNKQIEDFWTGRSNQNTDDFWTGPTMWARENKS